MILIQIQFVWVFKYMVRCPLLITIIIRTVVVGKREYYNVQDPKAIFESHQVHTVSTYDCTYNVTFCAV